MKMGSEWISVYAIGTVDGEEPIIINPDHIISIEKKKWAQPALRGGRKHFYQINLSNDRFFSVQEESVEAIIRTMCAHQRIGQPPKKEGAMDEE